MSTIHGVFMAVRAEVKSVRPNVGEVIAGTSALADLAEENDQMTTAAYWRCLAKAWTLWAERFRQERWTWLVRYSPSLVVRFFVSPGGSEWACRIVPPLDVEGDAVNLAIIFDSGSGTMRLTWNTSFARTRLHEWFDAYEADLAPRIMPIFDEFNRRYMRSKAYAKRPLLINDHEYTPEEVLHGCDA